MYRFVGSKNGEAYTATHPTFYVTNADCARLIKELKNQDVSFNINWVNQPADPTKVEIVVEDKMVIYSSEKYRNLHFAYDKRVGSEQVGLAGVMDRIKQLEGS